MSYNTYNSCSNKFAPTQKTIIKGTRGSKALQLLALKRKLFYDNPILNNKQNIIELPKSNDKT